MEVFKRKDVIAGAASYSDSSESDSEHAENDDEI